MPGVRLHHPELRSVTYTVTNYAVPLKAKMFCAACSGGPEGNSPRSVIHEFKTIHLNIDAVGDVVVAEGIYELLKRNGLLEELTATKGIPAPESMRLEIGKLDIPLTVSREVGVMN